jgi:hypothetical protein
MAITNFFRLGVCIGLMAVAACGSGQQSATHPTGTRTVAQTSAQTGAQPTNNVPGAPKKTDSKDVPTAPINIPPIFDKQGLPIDTVRASVESEIRDACGNGELCVTVTVGQGDNDTFTQCQYVTSNPQSFSDQEQFTLQRGSTLTLLTGPRPCESTTEETTEETTTGSTPAPTTPQPTSDVEPTP